MSSAPATLKNVRKLCGQQAVCLERLCSSWRTGRHEKPAASMKQLLCLIPLQGKNMGNPLDYDFNIRGTREGVTDQDFANMRPTGAEQPIGHNTRLLPPAVPAAGRLYRRKRERALSGVTIKGRFRKPISTWEPHPPIPLEPPRIYGCIMTAAHSLRSFGAGRDTDGNFRLLLFADGTKRTTPYGKKKKFLAGAYYRNSFMGKRAASIPLPSVRKPSAAAIPGGIYNYETVSNNIIQ